MTDISNREIADRLYDYAELLDVEDADKFRIRAYRNAALTILNTQESFAQKVSRGDDLVSLPTIGDDIARKIEIIVQTGELPELEALRLSLPPVQADLLKVEGIGPKRYRQIEKKLGVLTPDTLVKAASRGVIARLPGIGTKTQAAILKHFSGHRPGSSGYSPE